MRVSSLSDERIIRLVSDHFVPVWFSRDGYQLAKPTPADRDLLARIDASRRDKRLPSGAVCVYIVRADGEALATLPVQQASRPDKLAPFLRDVVRAEKLTARKPEEQKASAAPPPAPPRPSRPAARLFTVRSRFDDRTANRGTSKDVVELLREEWSAFLPPAEARPGQGWAVPRGVAEKLLRHAYPPLPHWDQRLARVTACELRCRVTAVSAGEVRFRLEGRLEMVYPDQGKPTDGRVEARLVGAADADPRAGALTAFALTSDGGRYSWNWQERAQAKAMSLAVELGP
jgi:hypothetical protein